MISLCALALAAGGRVQATKAAEAAPAAQTQTSEERIEALEERMSALESSAVLSEPETRVRKVEVWVDEDGVEHDEPVPGGRKTETYQRERVFRRQTISEKIEEAIADEDSRRVTLGIDAAMVVQQVTQARGASGPADGEAYALASADLFFSANIAQNTSLYADVVGLSGSPPDSEVGGLTLLNGYAARLVQQNQISLREAWVRTELFGQKLALTVGRLDQTAFFDRNSAANDETSQFVSDALVNNPMLGLSSNGAGLSAIYDPRGSFNIKVGLQQSNPDALNLSESLYTLAELGYRARPAVLGEGNYRFWFRSDNDSGPTRTAWGASFDQKLVDGLTVFARYGAAEAAAGHDHFYSGGVQFDKGMAFNPEDVWGAGYARTNLSGPDSEWLAEIYYSMHLSEKLRLSFHVQYLNESDAGGKGSYVVPGLRLQAGL